MNKKDLTVRRGESLVETLIAVFVLALAATGSLALILTAMWTTEKIEDRVIATNLAREGLEAVRVIRDTNWLVEGDRRGRWNCIGDEDCTARMKVAKKYVVDFDEDFKWRLYEVGDVNDNLDLADAGTNLVNDYLLVLKEQDGGKFYTHNLGGGGLSCLDGEEPSCEVSQFYRWVEFEKVEDEDEDVLRATVRVEWIDPVTDRVLNVTLVTYLTDFLGRGFSDYE